MKIQTLFLEVSFNSYIPSTIIGLLGLAFAYLYFYLKNKDDKKLEAIKSIKSSDRLRAIETSLNELGVHIDTTTLDSNQKFQLLTRSLNAKIRKYLIFSITTIILAIIFALANRDQNNPNSNEPGGNEDPIKTVASEPVDTIGKGGVIDPPSVASSSDTIGAGKTAAPTPATIQKDRDIEQSELCELNHAKYTSGGDFYIRFYNQTNNTYEFTGQIDARSIHGTVIRNGDNLKIISGNATGKFALNEACNFLTGSFELDERVTSFDYQRVN